MKAMVVHDSVFGNTGQVAQAIGDALATQVEVEVRPVAEVKLEEMAGLGLLVAGSPTRQFSPTGATTGFLKSIPKDGLNGVKVAAFDTRFTEAEIGKVRVLAFLVKIFGYAAEPIAKRLEKRGGVLAMPPEGFYVADVEGPLVEGELERAAEWAGQILLT